MRCPGSWHYEATGLPQNQNNSALSNSFVQPEQEVTIYANGTSRIDPSKLAGSIIQFDDAMTKVSSNATAMHGKYQEAPLDDNFAESRMAFQNGFQDLGIMQHDLKQSLADLETQDLEGVAVVKRCLFQQGWLEEKVDSVLGLIQGGVNMRMFDVAEDRRVEMWG